MTTIHRWTDAPIDFDGRVPLGEWVESLPTFEGRRPMMTCNGYLNLMRHMLAGGSVPYYADPRELLSDILVAHQIESSSLRRRAEAAELGEARYRPAIDHLWRLVFATGKRKTMRTDEVRTALEAAA